MSFNIEETLRKMAESFGSTLLEEWTGVKDCVEEKLADEKEALEEIALARLNNEINDDEMQSEIDDEYETLETVILACKVEAKASLKKALNKAMDAFKSAVKAAL